MAGSVSVPAPAPSGPPTNTHRSQTLYLVLQALYLVVTAIVLFVVAFWSALGLSPFSGTRVEWVFGVLLVSFVNLGVGTLGCGLVIEWRHYDWSPFRHGDQPVMIIILMLLLSADVGVAWWVFASDAGGRARWIFLIVMLAAIALGASLTYPWQGRDGHRRKALWPQTDYQSANVWWGPLSPLSIMLGIALGVAVLIAYLGFTAHCP